MIRKWRLWANKDADRKKKLAKKVFKGSLRNKKKEIQKSQMMMNGHLIKEPTAEFDLIHDVSFCLITGIVNT